MSLNPYQAPRRDPGEGVPEKPPEVRNGIKLWWAYAILILPSMSITTAPLGVTEALIFGPLVPIFLLPMVQLGRGKNWARLTMTTLFCITTLLTVRSLRQLLTAPDAFAPYAKLGGVSALLLVVPPAQILAGGFASYYLLTAPAQQWFSQKSRTPP